MLIKLCESVASEVHDMHDMHKLCAVSLIEENESQVQVYFQVTLININDNTYAALPTVVIHY